MFDLKSKLFQKKVSFQEKGLSIKIFV